jgi:hypothetical protein
MKSIFLHFSRFAECVVKRKYGKETVFAIATVCVSLLRLIKLSVKRYKLEKKPISPNLLSVILVLYCHLHDVIHLV